MRVTCSQSWPGRPRWPRCSSSAARRAPGSPPPPPGDTATCTPGTWRLASCGYQPAVLLCLPCIQQLEWWFALSHYLANCVAICSKHVSNVWWCSEWSVFAILMPWSSHPFNKCLVNSESVKALIGTFYKKKKKLHPSNIAYLSDLQRYYQVN